jgi:galactokinase/mevalonate kinase-like predicted kinase
MINLRWIILNQAYTQTYLLSTNIDKVIYRVIHNEALESIFYNIDYLHRHQKQNEKITQNQHSYLIVTRKIIWRPAASK